MCIAVGRERKPRTCVQRIVKPRWMSGNVVTPSRGQLQTNFNAVSGQLEAEIRQNAWLTVPASADILFNTPYEQRWQAATKSLGIDPANLSASAGNA